jgi:hypothetical protein
MCEEIKEGRDTINEESLLLDELHKTELGKEEEEE